MAFLFCGQTDSGKSTLAGHLLYNVGYFNNLSDEDEKFYRKYLIDIKESTNKCKFSILMDLIDGELTNNKTKTQDFNIINFEHENNKYTIIDTPGHKLYIRALIAGLFKIHLDVVIIVISSINNEFTESFEKGTIKEDLLLCRSTNCKNLVVLWNKCDISSVSPLNKEIFIDYCKKLQFANIEHLNVSGYTGYNIMEILKIVNKYKNLTDSLTHSVLNTPISNSTIILQCLLYPQDTIITAGYQCILHNQSGEYEIVIDAIKNVHIVKSGIPLTMKISLLTDAKNKTIQTFVGERIIFRNSNITLGFGVVKK